MTDEQLLQLIEETPAEELTAEQIAMLRERVPHSSQLQQAIRSQLRLEHTLAAVLGRVNVSVDAILARAARERGVLRRRLWMATGAAAAIAAALVWWWLRSPDPVSDPAPHPVAQQGNSDPPAPDGPNSPDGESPGPGQQNPAPAPETVVVSPETAIADEDEPWASAFKEEGDLPAFDEVCFDDFPSSQAAVTTDDLARWFIPIEPERLRVQISSRSAFVEGLVRLRPAWKQGLALRLATHSQQNLRLHLFSGNRGVTIWAQEYAEPGWAAYVTSRQGNDPRPSSYSLAATDGGRMRRLGRGTVELHYEAGMVVLSRGDVRLLTAPLPTPPTEIFIEGRAAWRGIELFRVKGLPRSDEPCPLVRRVDSPATIPWQKTLPAGARLQPQPDGSLRLTATNTAQPAYAWMVRPELGPYEYVFEIANPSPGTGLYLGDHQGKPVAALGAFREQRTGQVVLDYSTRAGSRDTHQIDDRRVATPYVTDRCWLKLVLGAGAWKCFISADGVNFTPMGERFETNVPAGCHTLGMYCLAGGNRQLTLHHLQVRELGALASLVEADLRDRALALDDMPDVGNWLAAVVRHQPPEVDDRDWRLACAVRTLGGQPSPALAAGLLKALATEGIAQPTPVAVRCKLLEQVTLLSNTLDERTALHLGSLYEELGRSVHQEGEPRPYSSLAASLHDAPFWGPAAVSLVPERLVRSEMLQMIYGGNWDLGADLARQIKFWNRTADLSLRSLPPGRENLDRLADWMLINVAFATPDQQPSFVPLANLGDDSPPQRRLRRRRQDERPSPPRFADWRHPFVEQVSKEGYNILAEFQAALSGDAYEDACQVITAAQTAGTLGLLPDAHDSQLFVSLPAAVALAMQDRPELRRTMQEKYGGIGQLRLRQAMRDGDTDTVRGVSVQFHGTHAAAEAHLWLGDRSLSSGDFAGAMGHYRTALETAPASLVHSLTARLRLAAAMVGREAGAPATQDVQFGGERLTASAFEQLVQELQQQRKPPPGVNAADGVAAFRLPTPARFEPEVLLEYAGTKGRDPNAAPQQVDWTARQLAVTPSGSRLYFSDGFVTTAFDIINKKELWSTEPQGSPLVHGWSCVATPPVVVAGHVLIRQVTQRGSQILCLEASTGKQVWESRADLAIASNPILLQDEVVAIAVSTRRDGNLTLSLVSFDARTGDLMTRQPLLQLADYWESRLPCHLVAIENRLVANCGGCVFSCNLLGQPRWLRRQIWLSPVADAEYLQQHHQAPLVVDKQVFSTQRGVRAIEAIDLDTGRLQWRTAVADIRRLLGVQAGVLVVETQAGWLGLSPDTGERLWHRAARGKHLEGVLVGDSGSLLIAEAQPWEGDTFRPVLAWIDAANGEEIAHAPLGSLQSKNPRLGPLTVWRDRVMGFAAVDAERDPQRTLYEFKRAGAAFALRPLDQSLQAWASASPLLHAATEQLAPGWTLAASLVDKETGLRSDTSVSPAVPYVATLANPMHPAQFVQRLEVPEGAKARLVLEAAAAGDQSWQLEVSAGDKILLQQSIGKTPFRRDIDLSAFAGQKTWLTAQQLYPQRGEAHARWRKLQVIITP